MTAQGTLVDVLLPLPLNQTFTYSVPEVFSGRLSMGSRVVVPFGQRKYYTAIVVKLHSDNSGLFKIKPILDVLDEHSIVLEEQLKFWQWISSYYISPMGDVLQAALPSGLKIESETRVLLNEHFEAQQQLPERESRILDLFVPGKEITVAQLGKLTGWGDPLPWVHKLVERGALSIYEGLREKYKVRTCNYVRLCAFYRNSPEKLEAVLPELQRARKQYDLLMKFLNMSAIDGESQFKEVEKKSLLENTAASPAVLQGLIARGILEIYELAVDRTTGPDVHQSPLSVLSDAQQQALSAVKESFKDKSVCLLHGQTSSGKTELYIHLIEECISQGKQALFLVPEIALTTQLSNRLRRVFGSKAGVYHSKFPDAQRVELWHKMLSDSPYDVVLGARSSVFLPYKNLGLVIVDEEHETSYKQQDPSPRYHARNAALVLAGLYGAKTLLGTATPSLETYANCLAGKYGLAELKIRHFDMQMPEIRVVDVKDLKRRKIMKGIFSPALTALVKEAVEAGEQAILFQNRRGYAPVFECSACAWVPKCHRCDVSLTYHKNRNRLTCHYCGFEQELPARCPSCDSDRHAMLGFGTEKIEEDVAALFPDVPLSRMDADTTQTRAAFERLIRDFESHKTSILIGTQMVSKGLDFSKVRVVGILNADQMLNMPDFRAHERAFQMMVQVSGRAGRKGGRGIVLLQTSSPELPVIQDIVTNNYQRFYQRETLLRKAFSYPPYTRLILIRLRYRDDQVVRKAAYYLAALLKPVFGERLLGPDQPSVARINNFHYQQLLLKVETGLSAGRIREALLWGQEQLSAHEKFKTVQIQFDVDPM